MRGQGRVFRPKVRGERTAIFWLDYSVNGERYRESSGTTVQAEALALLERRRMDRKAGRPMIEDPVPTTLAAFVEHHLQAKADSRRYTAGWLGESRHHLERAVAYFGRERRLASVTAVDVQRWIERLYTAPNGRGGTLDAASVRHHVNSLSSLFARARSEGSVPTGYDPVGDVLEKPTPDPDEPIWFEVPEAAVFLEAARTCPATPAANAQPPITFGYALIATFLLTGGRQDEVLGLEVADVDFDRRRLTFRPNEWRRLKTKKSHRTLPLWPQLEAILREHVFGGDRAPSRLLFPSYRTKGPDGKKRETMLTDIRKLLDRVTEHAGTLYLMDQGRKRQAEPGEVRTKAFRHTYITTRLQTLDHGQPVSLWTVAREVGHSSADMIERVYGHVGEIRHRSEAVEYRVEQHETALADRLSRM